MKRDYHQARAIVAAAMPGTRKAIMDATGFSRGTVEVWIRDLRRTGESHIVGWLRPTTFGPFVPVHGLTTSADRPCRLQPLTTAGHWLRAKAKRKQAEIDMKPIRQRALYWRQKAVKRQNTWLTPLEAA